ncbi:MAG: sulfatase-like hydrolase/transferase [Verrucomicrobiales bacterium]|nr:sulfatase-like hydrolase/transferase [Verrucomicrobiaceae bacterium]
MKSLRWILGLSSVIALTFAEAAKTPNVLFILVDDMGYGDLSCYGAPDVKTPRIDELAEKGIRFTQYYANGAECTPTRTALLTGRYPQRVKGMECALGTGNVGRYDDAIALAEKHQLGLPPSEAILPQIFKEAGYATGIFGKWHLGYEPQFHPRHYGFDRFFGVLGGNCHYFTHRELSDISVLYRDDNPVEEKGYMTHLITKEALSFLDEHEANPFFLYVPYTTPHFPFQTPEDAEKNFSSDNWSKGTRESYVGMLEDMDYSVGQLLDRLEKHDLTKNTLVIFGSDHGGMGPSRNAPFRGSKGGLFEGGIRTAMIASWPGELPERTVSSQPCVTFDFTYSLARIAGLTDEGSKRLDGMNILDHVIDNYPDKPRTLFWRAKRGSRTWKAVRKGDWKYIHKVQDGKTEEWYFNIKTDPEEAQNQLGAEETPADELSQQLAIWEKEMSAQPE